MRKTIESTAFVLASALPAGAAAPAQELLLHDNEFLLSDVLPGGDGISLSHNCALGYQCN